eukprot:UN30498
MDGYTEVVGGGMECKNLSCDSGDETMFGSGAIIFGVIFLIFILYCSDVSDKPSGISCYISLYGLQMASFYLFRFELNEPLHYLEPILYLFRFDYISIFHSLKQDSLIYEFCVLDDIDISTKIGFSACFPLLLIILIFLINHCCICCCKSERRHFTVVVNAFLLCVAPIIYSTAKLLTCANVDGKLVMLYYDMDCYQFEHAAPWFLLVFMLACLGALYSAQKKRFYAESQNNSFIGINDEDNTFLSKQFHSGYYWFGLFLSIYRIITVLVAASLVQYPIIQSLAMVLTSIIWLIITNEHKPYKDKWLNRYQNFIFIMLILLGIINSCIGVYIHESESIRDDLKYGFTGLICICFLTFIMVPLLSICFATNISDEQRSIIAKRKMAEHRASVQPSEVELSGYDGGLKRLDQPLNGESESDLRGEKKRTIQNVDDTQIQHGTQYGGRQEDQFMGDIDDVESEELQPGSSQQNIDQPGVHIPFL